LILVVCAQLFENPEKLEESRQQLLGNAAMMSAYVPPMSPKCTAEVWKLSGIL